MQGGSPPEEDATKRNLCRVLPLLLCAVAFGQEKLTIGYFYLEPFTIAAESGMDPTGMSVDYFEELVAPKMGVSIEWVGPLPIARMYQYLDTAEVDAIFVVVKNPDREKRYLFASEPYCRGHASLWVLKESPLDELTRTEDILGWTIGFVEGSVINGFLSHDKIRIENVHGEDYKRINFDKLLAKRLDAIYDHNEYTLAYESTKMGIRDRLRVIFLPIDQSSYYTAFAKTKRGIELLSRYDAVNAGIPVGAVDAIMRRYTGN